MQQIAIRLAVTLAIAAGLVAAAVWNAPARKAADAGAEPSATGTIRTAPRRKASQAGGIVPQFQHGPDRLSDLVGQGFKRTKKLRG